MTSAIGAGKGLEAGTFWSGLIDDVRIYSYALSEEEIGKIYATELAGSIKD